MKTEWNPVGDQIKTRWAEEIDPNNPLPEYPRPQLKREKWKNLNGLWNYLITKRSVSTYKEFKKHMNGKLEEKILVPYSIESSLSGVKKSIRPKQRLWYQRTFKIPEEWEYGKRSTANGREGDEAKDRGDQKIILHFGAVDWKATVFVDGNKVGTHKGGYTPFSLDITGALDERQKNNKEEHELVVSVWDPTTHGGQNRGKQVLHPWGVFYTSVTGIWQTVWIEPVPQDYIKSINIRPNIDKSEIKLLVSTNVIEKSQHYTAEIYDGENLVQSETSLTANKNQRIHIPNQKLWSPSDPFLYHLNIKLNHQHEGTEEGPKEGPEDSSEAKMRNNPEGQRPKDNVESYFGMRKISLKEDHDGNMRIALNDEIMFQYGPLDQGYWPDGIYTPPSDEALRYDVEITRKMGFNMTRKHIKIEPARWYYYCDKLGLPVWQDVPSAGLQIEIFFTMLFGKKFSVNFQRLGKETQDQYYRELHEMVEALYNHPSIIMWIPFNESWGQFKTKYAIKCLRSLDSSRLINNASGWVDNKVGDIKDVHKYPGPGIPDPDEEDDLIRALVNGEFGGISLEIPSHCWEMNRKWGYRKTKNKTEYLRKYKQLTDEVKNLIPQGLAAAVYTQLTDVEGEINGLITYDREIPKIEIETLSQIHEKLYKE